MKTCRGLAAATTYTCAAATSCTFSQPHHAMSSVRFCILPALPQCSCRRSRWARDHLARGGHQSHEQGCLVSAAPVSRLQAVSLGQNSERDFAVRNAHFREGLK